MKVTGIKTTIVAVPAKPREEPGLVISGPGATTAVLVELSTDEGLVGIGEAPDVIGAEITQRIIDTTAPALVRKDPFDIERIMKELYGLYNLTHLHIHAANWGLCGVEMALWDLMGKACGRPLYQLWGGAYRKQIPFYGSIDRTSPQDVAAQAKELVERGFKTLYTKVGFAVEEDLECVRLMREAAGWERGLQVRVDANQAWMPGEAVRIINRMAEFDPEFVDQPVLMYNLEALARVRRAVSVPIAAHEASWTFYQVLEVIKQGAADVIHIDPRFDAGFIGARKAAAIAEAAGLPVVQHSFAELGVAQAALLHLIASCPNFVYANQQSYDRLADDVLEGGPMPFHEGCLALPEAPGIGVALDPERVARYQAYYEENLKGQTIARRAVSPRYMLMSQRRFFGY